MYENVFERKHFYVPSGGDTVIKGKYKKMFYLVFKTRDNFYLTFLGNHVFITGSGFWNKTFFMYLPAATD